MPGGVDGTVPIDSEALSLGGYDHCPLQRVATDLSKNFNLPDTKIKVLSSPIVHTGIDEMAKEEIDLSLKEGEVLIIGIGELCARKDFSTLIKAFSIVQMRLPARLIILGEGRQRSLLE